MLKIYKTLPLHAADPGLITSIPNGLPSNRRSDS